MYEYKIIKSDFHWKDNVSKFEDKLNEFARDGWRVVNVTLETNSSAAFVAFLERSKVR